MSRPPTYGSPAAFRRALTDRLRAAAQTTPWSLPQLQRQIAYDRLLERLYLVEDTWIVKGAIALIARGLGVRATIDIDVYRAADREVAEAELRRAAISDIGDWFRFALGPSRPIAEETSGVRLPVVATVGTTPWAQFHVDVVGANVRMTGLPEDVPPLARLAMPDVEQHGYRAYPLVDHIADKVAAIVERHGELRRASTRFKDLVDLVAVVMGATIPAEPQMAALRSEAERRGITLPDRFHVPDLDLWEGGYAAEAGRSLLPMARTLAEALAVVRPFIDPLLTGNAAGRWDPILRTWTTSPTPSEA
jgi:nucleotidyltransferase AbiEii toxin of type IV toxin-antitoxin system